MNTMDALAPVAADEHEEDQFLRALGERVRALRARRGLTRRNLSAATGVSERYLANLEYGTANPSIRILRELRGALNCSLAELIGDETASSPEWLLLRDLLVGRSETDLQRARALLSPLFGAAPTSEAKRLQRIALIGLRGAGKSTLGRMLAKQQGVEFVEISREIEHMAGVAVAEISNLYGTQAYHRYERRALDETLAKYADVVIGTPGSIVSEPATFGLLLAHCYTIWVQASPEEHMRRVVDQGGDLQPIADNASRAEAMDDLKHILSSRAALYGKADLHIDTAGLNVTEAFAALKAGIENARRLWAMGNRPGESALVTAGGRP